MVRCACLLAVALCFLGACAQSAGAGSNAQGVAWLSWDREGTITTLDASEISSVPLYVHLGNTGDIRQLAVWVTVSPSDSATHCYRFVAPPPAVLPDSGCGVAVPAAPHADFAGDTTYDWTISFAPGSAHPPCIAYYLAASSCSPPSFARFTLRSVVTIDSTSALDTLAVTGDAIIDPNPVVDGVFPVRITAGATTRLSITGSTFADAATLSLVRGSDTLVVAGAVSADSGELVAQVTPAATAAGPCDVLLAFPDGRTTVAPDALTIASTTESQVTTNRPTDDDYAFTRVNVHTHGPAPGLWDNVYLYGYPDSLSTSNLLVTRSSTDTVGYFMSMLTSGVSISYARTWPRPGFARYMGQNRTYSSVGLLSMAANSYQADVDKPFLKVVTVHATGDSTCTDLRVGRHIRNWLSGTDETCPGQTFHTAPLTDTLCAEVYSGPRYDDECFYDVQEVRIPSPLRASGLYYVEMRQDSIFRGYPCSDGTTYLLGLSLWNDYRVSGMYDRTVPLEAQYDEAWATDDYGGYYYDDTTLVGQEMTVADRGCYLACLAMGLDFYGGYTRSLGYLNDALQWQRGGFLRRSVATITGVFGDSVTFRFTGRVPRSPGWSFLVERGQHVPVATIWVTSQGESTGSGLVGRTFEGRAVEGGQYGHTYSIPNDHIQDWGVGQVGWEVVHLGRGAGTAARAESALACNQPVALIVLVDSLTGVGSHWVVADGREPAFLPGGQARGTYHINDPGGRDNSGLPLSRLIQAPYGNQFAHAAWLRATEGQQPLTGNRNTTVRDMANVRHRLGTRNVSQPGVASTTSTGSAGSGLAFVLQGPGTLAVTDPVGRRIVYNNDTYGYDCEVPGATTISQFAIASSGSTTPELGPLDVIRIPGAPAGVYLVDVEGGGAGMCALDMLVPSGSGESSGWTTSGLVSEGSAWHFLVTYSPTTASLSVVTTDVPKIPGRPVELAVSPNPASNGARIGFDLPAATTLDLGVYDITGRCVQRLATGRWDAGHHTTVWDCRSSAGDAVMPGVYFVRLSHDGLVTVRRTVVVR